MTDPIRQQIATAADLIVVKVGTRVLTGPDGLLDSARIDSLGRQIDAVSSDGRRVVLVSSGAVGAGMGRIGLTKRPSELAQLQAVAAIGQSCLIEAYERALRGRGPGHHGLTRTTTSRTFDPRRTPWTRPNALPGLLALQVATPRAGMAPGARRSSRLVAH